MTELTFLLELLLNHRLQKPTKDAIKDRIKEVEQGMLMPKMAVSSVITPQGIAPVPPQLVGQAPSTVAALMKHPDLLEKAMNPPQQPAVVAQTPQAVEALNQRQAAINQALSGKPEKGRTSPRKF